VNIPFLCEVSSRSLIGECLPDFDVMTDAMTLDDTSKLNAFFRKVYVALSLSIEKRDDTSFPRSSVINCLHSTLESEKQRCAQPFGDCQNGRNFGDKTGTARNDAL
jgi:hypothetical protein